MAETRPVSVPVFQEYMNPILDVLRREGRALTIEQLDKRVIDVMRLPTEVASVPHDAEKPDRSEVSYRIAWSRSYLKKAGLLDNPARARWGISDKGSTAGEIDAYELAVRIGEATKSAAAAKSALGDAPSVGGEASDADEDVDEELLTARVGEPTESDMTSTACGRQWSAATAPRVVASRQAETTMGNWAARSSARRSSRAATSS
jgi:restriction endonuclease Mrr